MMSLRGVAWDAYTHEWALDHDLEAMEDAGERVDYEKKEVQKAMEDAGERFDYENKEVEK